jgi:hypothetical protein
MNDINELKETEKQNNGHNENWRGPVTPWAAGVFMILLGGVFLVNMNDLFDMGSSRWAIWLLIPAYWVVISAWSAFHSDSPDARSKSLTILLFGLMPFAFAALPALGFNAQFIAPLVLIVIGLSMIIRRTLA